MIRVFDIVSSMIEDKRTEHPIKRERIAEVEECCKNIELVMEECNSGQVTVDILEDGSVLISFIASYIACQFDEVKLAYIELVEHSNSFRLYNVNDGDVCVEFIFPSVFE